MNIVNPHRLIRPVTDFQAFPGLDFRGSLAFETCGESVLVTDPTYLADVYNSQDRTASFIRQHGVIVKDFGGDINGPIWWQSPFVMLPLAGRLLEAKERADPPLGVTVLADEVGCDSGSFLFLPLKENLPVNLRTGASNVLDRKNGVLLSLPAGNWTVWYEQLPSDGWDPAFFRNIVVRWEPDETLQPRLPLS